MVDQDSTPNPEPTPAPKSAEEIEAELAATKAKLAKIESEKNDFRKQLDQHKIDSHKQSSNWQEVAKIHEEKAKDFETKYTRLSESLISSAKTQALTAEAVKQGINPVSIPDLELLDFQELSVETTSTGKILVSGADRAIAKLKTMRPFWFGKTPANINPQTPEAGKPQGAVTFAELQTAQANYKKTGSDADRQIYYETLKKYQATN